VPSSGCGDDGVGNHSSADGAPTPGRRSLGYELDRAQKAQGGGGRFGQQDLTVRLGSDGAQEELRAPLGDIEIGADLKHRIGAGDGRVVRRDEEPAAAGDRQTPGDHSASSALT